MTVWDRLRELPVCVTGLELEELQLPVRESWTRRTRLLRLHGRQAEGCGEDVSWVEVSEAEILALYPEDLLIFEGSLQDWCARLDAREATPAYLSLATARQSEPDYLRWALESAALELALRQNQTTLAERLARTPEAIRFCLSMGLGNPPTTERLRAWLAHGSYRFKLDAEPSWSPALIAELAALQCVEVVDFKHYYQGTIVDQEPDPALLERVLQGLPTVCIEDAKPDADTHALLLSHQSRLSWDAPIHQVEDIARVLPEGWPTPKYLNIKPSRFGSWRRLSAVLAWAHAHGVQLYGGGQFELGIGREQAQALASLFYPQAANDLAPVLFHTASPRSGLPVSTMRPETLNSTHYLFSSS